MTIHRTIDAKVLASRRQRVESALAALDRVVLVGCGEPIGKPGGFDQTYAFIPHPVYRWLTGRTRPGGALAFDPRGGWTSFQRPVTPAEPLWDGEASAADDLDVEKLPAWLAARGARSAAVVGAPVPGVEAARGASSRAAALVDAARRPKDDAEIALMERAVEATAAGFARVRAGLRSGISERTLQIELEAAMFHAGAEGTSFDTIVGAGANAAALHARPGAARTGAEELLLVDAGAEIQGYAADVSRTYPVSGRFTSRQRAMVDAVVEAKAAATARCHPGTEWFDVHRSAAAVLAEHLKDLGILTGDPDGLLDSGAIALFFPHGVGHLVGLGVRDAGGRLPGRPERRCCGARLRVDLPLEAGMVVTVEPGLYFAPALLDDPVNRERFRDAVTWDALERWRALGGVRIEDDLLITRGEPRNLTEEIP